MKNLNVTCLVVFSILFGCTMKNTHVPTNATDCLPAETLCNCYVISVLNGEKEKLFPCNDPTSLNQCTDTIYINGKKILNDDMDLLGIVNGDSCLNSRLQLSKIAWVRINGEYSELNMGAVRDRLLVALDSCDVPYPNGNFGAKKGEIPKTSLIKFRRNNNTYQFDIIHINHEKDELVNILYFLREDSIFQSALSRSPNIVGMFPIKYYRIEQMNSLYENKYGVQVVKN